MTIEINTDEFWADHQMQKLRNEKCYLAKVEEHMQIEAALANPLALLKQINQLTTERDKLKLVIEEFDDLIKYQYTGSKEAMSALQEAAWAAREALKERNNGMHVL